MSYRDYAVQLIEDGVISADQMVLCLLSYMSEYQVEDALAINELSDLYNEEEV